MKLKTFYSHLECIHCLKTYDKREVHNYCHDCNQPLLARYSLPQNSSPKDYLLADDSMWRYQAFLPIEKEENIISLGEGRTPILPLNKLASAWNIDSFKMKDESGNPTGSFKARGLSMAVSKAIEMGKKSFCIPTAGNAGSALSAYCAKADAKANIFMPEATPKVFQLDCEIAGAKVTKVPGSIKDAGAKMAKEKKENDWWDVTTLKEPFRLEGKKTMGYEIAEQYNYKLPDVILYPTGGGTGLIGIWKAFKEMLEMGWIDKIPSRMVAVQTDVCNPIVNAFKAGQEHAPLYDNPGITIANGLRVPKAFGDRLILSTLYESKGTAISISDSEMLAGLKILASQEGLFISPEGAAVLMAADKLNREGFIKPDDSVLLLNTGSAYKYVENLVV